MTEKNPIGETYMAEYSFCNPCVLIGFVHGKENKECMKVLLGDIFAQMKVWGGKKRTYYCRPRDLHFNCKALCVNRMAQNWLMTQSGGGSHSTEYFLLLLESNKHAWEAYRCIDCIEEDHLDSAHAEFVCRHIDILKPLKCICDIFSWMKLVQSLVRLIGLLMHFFFPLESSHRRAHRSAFVQRYLGLTKTETATIDD